MSEQSPIDELFDRDPLDLTTDDHKAIVAQLRKEREAFIAAGEDPRKVKTKISQQRIKNITLGDLEL